jgi:hypothetical protein
MAAGDSSLEIVYLYKYTLEKRNPGNIYRRVNAMKYAALKPFMRIAIRKRSTFVDVLYGERVGDPRPFILTVSPRYVSRKTSQSLPLNINQVQDYTAKYADTVLREIAISRRDAGYTTHVL